MLLKKEDSGRTQALRSAGMHATPEGLRPTANSFHRRLPHSLASFIAALIVASLCVEVQADLQDKQFLDGLRQRRLYRLAEVSCEQRLATELSDLERAEFTIELLRSYATHAINSPVKEREPLWAKSRDVAAEFISRHASNPQLLRVRFEEALTLLARGELARQEAEVGRRSEDALATALTTIREAIRLLERLEKDVVAAIPRSQNRSDDEAVITASELLSLQNHVRYQLARGFRNRALCYPVNSQDRIAALTSATTALKQIVSLLGRGDSLIWDVQVDHVTCLRLLGNYRETVALIGSMDQAKPPAEVRLQLRAETIRMTINMGRLTETEAVLRQGREINGVVSGDLDFAHVEAYLTLWQAAERAQDKATAKQWRERAVTMVKYIEQQHGPYWGRRADLLLVNVAGQAPAAGNLEIMMRFADNLYRKREFDEAIAAYEKAATQAESGGDLENAYVMLYKAVLIEKELGDRSAVLKRLRTLALRLKEHQRASDTHLSAVKVCVELARVDPKFLTTYEELLSEHLAQWPGAATADTVRIWRGKTLEAKRQWSAAAMIYSDVDLSSTQLNTALQGADRAYHELLKAKQANGEDVAEELHRALHYYEGIAIPNNMLPARWSAAQRTAALSVAKLHLNYNSAGAARCEMILRAALQGQPPADDDWKSRATAWLVVALASQPDKQEAAKAELTKIGGARPNELYKMLLSLSDLSDSAAPAMKRSLANLRLSVVATLQPTGTSFQAAQQQTIRFQHADALGVAGRIDEAVTAFASLAKSYPKDGRIQESYGDVLLASNNDAALQQALTQWRLIGKRSRPKSERWFKAKYNIAFALSKSGDKKRAAEVLGILEITTDLNSTQWGVPIRRLLQQCKE